MSLFFSLLRYVSLPSFRRFFLILFSSFIYTRITLTAVAEFPLCFWHGRPLFCVAGWQDADANASWPWTEDRSRSLSRPSLRCSPHLPDITRSITCLIVRASPHHTHLSLISISLWRHANVSVIILQPGSVESLAVYQRAKRGFYLQFMVLMLHLRFVFQKVQTERRDPQQPLVLFTGLSH